MIIISSMCFHETYHLNIPLGSQRIHKSTMSNDQRLGASSAEGALLCLTPFHRSGSIQYSHKVSSLSVHWVIDKTNHLSNACVSNSFQSIQKISQVFKMKNSFQSQRSIKVGNMMNWYLRWMEIASKKQMWVMPMINDRRIEVPNITSKPNCSWMEATSRFNTCDRLMIWSHLNGLSPSTLKLSLNDERMSWLSWSSFGWLSVASVGWLSQGHSRHMTVIHARTLTHVTPNTYNFVNFLVIIIRMHYGSFIIR